MDDASLALLGVSARAWAREFIVSWRAARRVASPAVREEVARLPFPYEGPTRAVVRLRVDDDSPVTIFGVELSPTSDALDLDVEVVVARTATTGVRGPEAEIERLWTSARTNWFPGREPSAPLDPWRILAGRLSETGATYVVVPGAPSELSVASLVAHYFRQPDPPTPPPPAPEPAPPPPTHLYKIRQGREDAAIGRWMYGHCSELLAALGLPSGWWCGLWLLRDDVFGDGADGDVDLVAGPLRLDLRDDEFTQRVCKESGSRPLATDPGWIRNVVLMEAARDGHVVWPPRVDKIVACEVKASWFDGVWRRSHASERARVKVTAQLAYDMSRGVDRVALLHLCATKPRAGVNNPWLAAGKDVDAALESAPSIFEPADLSGCGYFLSVLGAVERHAEDLEGASSGLIARQPVAQNPRADATAAWRERLRARLAAMPKPSTLRTYIVPCPRCGSWTHATFATREMLPCSCTSR